MRDGVRRLVGLAVLCLLFVGMVSQYSVAAVTSERTARSAHLLESAGEHVGEAVYVWATVERSGDPLVVDVGGRSVTVRDTAVTAAPGDAIQVAGTITSRGTIAASRVVVSERSNLSTLYAVSAVALGVVVVAFFRFWAVDWRRLAFTERESDSA